MKVLVIGGNRYVGLRVCTALDAREDVELHVLNRTGQVAHTANAVVHKGDRRSMEQAFLDKDWDVVLDFATFTAADARASLQFFGRVDRYIFISTASVYDAGMDLKEESFEPQKWPIKESPTEAENRDYQFGKRQAEAVFAQQSEIPVTMIRFPVILGPDDYTHRLNFHIERIQNGQPIFMPNPKAKLSMISSADAADFMLWSISQKFTGPLNVASADAPALFEMLNLIEKSTGKKTILINKESDNNHSPYGAPEHWTMNVERLFSLGFKTKPVKDWLPQLIDEQAGTPSGSGPHKVH